jgi:hypothetical protein
MKRIGILLLSSLILASPASMGAVSDEEFAQLRADFAALADRVEQLAAENAALRKTSVGTATSVAEIKESGGGVDAPSWTDRISMDGDFRYRYENIDEEGEDERNRSRIRARANVRAQLPSNVEVGIGLATGGDDPVSANQTLGAGGSSKSITLNLAYADWTATEGLHLIAGKFKNPLLRVGKQALMWDGDWTPEGLAFKYQRGWFFANGLGTWLESDSKAQSSNFSWGGQVGAGGELGGAALKGGLGYFALKTQGDRTYFGDPNDTDNYFGNTAIGADCDSDLDPDMFTDCVYAYDYLLTQGFAEIGFDIGGFPTVLFADYVYNSDPDDNNTAWTAGFRAGQVKDRGQFRFSYFYAKKEADAMLGLVTDSDFAGGGTDNEGHFLRAQMGINRSWEIGVQYFINELDISTGTKTDYNRLMLDTAWKYK